jgi:hypothetical protein
MDREDIEPWYKQFWPWFIIALLSSSVIAGLTTVWISLQTTDSLVVSSGDDVQMIAERRINAEQLASELGLSALLAINPRTGAISVAMQSGVLTSVPQRLDLEFSHPAFVERDQLLTLHLAQPDAAGNPVWSGHFVTVPAGRWYVTLSSGEDWRVAGEWQGETQLTLRPAGGDHDRGR